MTNTQADYVKAFAALTVPLLRARAAAAGIAGRSKMNKAELVDALADFEVAQSAGADVPAEKCLLGHGMTETLDAIAPLPAAHVIEEAHAEAVVLDEKRTIVRASLSIPTGVELSWGLIEQAFEAYVNGREADVPAEKCLLEHGYVKPCQQDRGHAGECDKETVGLVRKTGSPQAPRVAIHTAGELHAAPEMPVPDFVFNLSRLLDDPAHKPDAELIELDGTHEDVQDFVFETDGAIDLFWSIVSLIEDQVRRGKSVVVLILCRGGKHRSVAFGDRLAAHFSVEATHHHRHLPRVVRRAAKPATLICAKSFNSDGDRGICGVRQAPGPRGLHEGPHYDEHRGLWSDYTMPGDRRPRCPAVMPALPGMAEFTGPTRVCNLMLNADGVCPDVNHHKHLPRVIGAKKYRDPKLVVMLGHECACGHLVAHHQEIWGPTGGIGRGSCQIARCACTELDVNRRPAIAAEKWDAAAVGPISVDARLIQERAAAEDKLHELRCSIAYLVGRWQADSSPATQLLGNVLDSVLKEHR